MYKIYNIDYLSQIIPNTRGDDSVYIELESMKIIVGLSAE